ncbi:MAG: acyl-CoA dehydrogenase family protein [Myxococcota bacterium]
MSEDHRMYAESTRAFFESELKPNLERWRDAGQVDRQFWRQAGDIGLLGATIPEAYGGAGGAKSLDAVAYYEHGRTGDSGWGFAIQGIVAHYLIGNGTEAQKARWLPPLATGERVAAIAMSEPGAGSDLQGVQTTATRDGDEYVIDGSKTFITNGQTADLICVVAKTDRSVPGSKGISLLMVETEAATGFTRGRNLRKLGQKNADTSELFFEGVRVPADFLLGDAEGQGFRQLMQELPWERLIIALGCLGTMDFVLEETLRYTQERKAFGQRIYDFQNTRFKLAECKTKVEVTRSFLHDCVARADAGTLDAATASMAKAWASDTLNDIADECLQLFGGYGYMLEYPISHVYADARVHRIYGGSNEIMKELIARSLDQRS